MKVIRTLSGYSIKSSLSARLYAESKCNEPNHSIHNVFTYLNQIIKYDLEPLRYLYFTTIRSEHSVISKEAFVSLLQNGNFLWEKMILVNGMGDLRKNNIIFLKEKEICLLTHSMRT